MCATCGCGVADVRVQALDHERPHGHPPDGPAHPHEHPPHQHIDGRPPDSRVVEIETALLAKNDHLAGHNRAWLIERGILALNLMSSPGSGKTSLLCRTITEVAGSRAVGVIEGDQETRIDAEKIRGTGAPVVQINTGAGCHLDADMLARGLAELRPPPGSLVFIENVGNLVCPALFDLGEAARVVVVSVTEGEDKPLKYPTHVRRRRPGPDQQDRPAALRRREPRCAGGQLPVGEPARHGDSGIGHHRRGAPTLA